MRNIARLSDNDRRELFRNTADKMGLNDAIVEKDFWVCFTLDYLFHRSPWKESITFKGGTSLSKAFHLISRFSEDIDLILDWRVLGYGKDEPWEKRSNTKQDAFNKEANVRAEVFLSETFCPAVKAGLSQEIGCEANVYIDEKDKRRSFSPIRTFYKYGDLTGDPFRDWCAGSVDSCKNSADRTIRGKILSEDF